MNVIERLEALVDADTWTDSADEILAVRDTLPDLLKLARVAKDTDDSFRAGVGWPKFLASLEAALEPLFREVPS